MKRESEHDDELYATALVDDDYDGEEKFAVTSVSSAQDNDSRAEVSYDLTAASATPNKRVCSNGRCTRPEWLCSTLASYHLACTVETQPFWYLYVSHVLSSWGDRMWAFALPIIYEKAFPFSMLLPLLYMFVTQFCSFLAGPYIGMLVDRMPRLRVVRFAIFIQNASILITSCLSMLLTAYASNESYPSAPLFYVIFAGICVCASIGEMAALADSVAVSRDWVVVISRAVVEKHYPHESKESSDKRTEENLSALNSMMRRLDLLCEMVAPVVMGALLDVTHILVGLVIVAFWNTLATVPEYLLLASVYRSFPQLAVKATPASEVAPPLQEIELNDDKSLEGADGEGDVDDDVLVAPLAPPIMPPPPPPTPIRQQNPLLVLYRGWKGYVQHPVFLASLSYVLLYITVLTPGVVLTAYLEATRTPTIFIGLFRSVGSFSGILSTFAVPPLITWLGVEATGMLCLIVQLGFLTTGCAIFYFSDSLIAIGLFLGFIVLSRCGLWGFDLVEVQIMQTYVEENQRGIINGTESALTKVAFLTILGLGLIFSHTQDFAWLVFFSLNSVTLAALAYVVFMQFFARRRN